MFIKILDTFLEFFFTISIYFAIAVAIVFPIYRWFANKESDTLKNWGRFFLPLIYIFLWVTFIYYFIILFTLVQPYAGYVSVLRSLFCTGIDGLSIFFLILTTFLFPLCILLSPARLQNQPYYVLLLLVLELLLIQVFTTLNLWWFFVFFEGTLIPIYLLIGRYGSGERRVRAANLFFVFTFVGSLLILIGLFYIYSIVGSLEYAEIKAYNFTKDDELLLWLALFASFATKVPIVPVHIWLPEAHVEAPTAGSVLLAGILLKLGSYGFIRFSIPLFPIASQYFAPLVILMGAVGVFYTALTAIRQTDVKRIIAYASISHINLIMIGLFSNTYDGVVGSVLQGISHGLVASALFFCIGHIYDRAHTRSVAHYGGLVYTIPWFSFFFCFFTMANIAIPLTSNFVGEFFLLLGSFATCTWMGVVGATGIILSAAYSLWLLNRICFGVPKTNYMAVIKDIAGNELAVHFLLLAGTFWIGTFPEFAFDVIYSAVVKIIIPVNYPAF